MVIGEAMDDSMYLTFTLWLVSSFNNPLDIIEMNFLWKYDTEVLENYHNYYWLGITQ